MSECEERLDIHLFVPSVSEEDSLVIVILATRRESLAVVVGRVVFQLHREGERQLSARVHVSEEYVSYCTSSLGSAVPSQKD